MPQHTREKSAAPQDMPGLYRQFAKSQDGTITVFALFMVFIMMIVCGIGVDMMRHEMERTRIQAVADRAVLAAADLDQTQDPEFVVRDYFEKSGMANFVSDVQVDQGVNHRTVTVDADTTVKTMFMRHSTPWKHAGEDDIGPDTLYVPARSTAEEKVNKVEISLVLDISGSMRHNDKMVNMRDAAGVFVDTVLTQANEDLISVNVVPYTAQVNAGKDIAELMDLGVDLEDPNSTHQYSYCVDFEDVEFGDTAIYANGFGSNEPYEHMQHFEASWAWHGWYNTNDTSILDRITNPSCPKQSYEEIQAYQQDPEVLKANIDQFQPRANTSIHLGMKWGVAMLDPAWRQFNAALTDIDPAFVNRPADYGTDDTLKTVVLMTDGINVTTRRITDQAYDSRQWRDIWSAMPLYSTIQNYNLNSNDFRYTKYTPQQADGLLESICDAAKQKKIIIWSIGFEVNDHGADVMRDCASSPSHFFRVEGVEITEAFSSIARQINQLRLTQ